MSSLSELPSCCRHRGVALFFWNHLKRLDIAQWRVQDVACSLWLFHELQLLQNAGKGVRDGRIGMRGSFSEEHIWVGLKDGRLIVGVTDWLQKQLGEVTYVDLPEVGEILERGEPFGEIESVRTIKELVAPISGEVLQVNADLESEPMIVNEDSMGEGWLLQVRPDASEEFGELMDEEEYEQFLESQEEQDVF